MKWENYPHGSHQSNRIDCALLPKLTFKYNSMAPVTSSSTRIDKWTDYYNRNRKDGGPIQALFGLDPKTLNRKAESNLNNVGRLTDFITGSSYGNMVLVPGRPGQMQLVHHGFACNTQEGFTLAFAHGNLGDCTAFKTVPREEMVAPVAGRAGEDGEGDERNRSAPTLDSLLGAESSNEFANLEAEGNDILHRLPNHCFITPATFIGVGGSKRLSAKELAFHLIDEFQSSVEDDDELSAGKEEEAAGLEGILAMLWASENGMLAEIRLDDVPEEPTMSHMIKDVRRKIGGERTPPAATNTTPGTGDTAAAGASIEMMACRRRAWWPYSARYRKEPTTTVRRKSPISRSSGLWGRLSGHCSQHSVPVVCRESPRCRSS